MIIPLLSSLFVCLSCAGPPAGADSTAGLDTTLATGALSEIVVTAARLETTLAAAPSRVTVLDGSSLAQTGAQSLADLVDKRSGAFLQRYGPSEMASLSLRGTSSSQSAILLDGRRITPPQIDVFDLTLLPTVLLESVEILHGAASPLYGSDGIGGAVNVRTLQPGAAASWRASASYGAYGERTGSALLSLEEGGFATVGAFEIASAENDFPYLHEASFPAETRRRRNADTERRSAYLSTSYETERHSLRLSTWYDEAERGLPGLATAPSSDERQWDRQFRLWADADRRLERGSLHLRGLLQHTALRYQDTGQDLDQTGRALVGGLELEARRPVGASWTIGGGADGAVGQAVHPSLSEDAGERHGALFAYGSGPIGPALLYPALRLDGIGTPGGGRLVALSPRLGVNLPVWSRAGLFAKASAGRTFRSPTLNDRFWQPGGNPDLAPERGWAYDAGLFLERAAGRVEVSAFLHHVQDQIVWQAVGGDHWSPFNLRRVRTSGIEASLHTRRALTTWLEAESGLFYTLTHALDRSDPESSAYNRQLRYVPRESLKAHLSLTAGALTLDLNGQHTGRRYITRDESQHLEPFIVLGAQLRLTRPVGAARVHLGLALENALDADYAVMAHRPMPPRHARLRLTLEPNR